MSNVIDFNMKKKEMAAAEAAMLEAETEELNVAINRAALKGNNGKTVSDREVENILRAMSGLALSKSSAWDDLTDVDFEGMEIYGAPKGTEF